MTLLVSARLRAWRDRAATSPGCLPRRLTLPVSGLSCCESLSPEFVGSILGNAGYPAAVLEMGEVQETAHKLGLDASISEIRRAEDIALAFEVFSGHVQALYVVADPLTGSNRVDINRLALGARLPTVHGIREYAEAGGLISYGPNIPDLFRRAAEYVDKILREQSLPTCR